jgi:hypothetical protein
MCSKRKAEISSSAHHLNARTKRCFASFATRSSTSFSTTVILEGKALLAELATHWTRLGANNNFNQYY